MPPLPLPSLIQVVERFPTAALLLDDHGFVLGSNEAARGMLGLQPGTPAAHLARHVATLDVAPSIARSPIHSEAGAHELVGLSNDHDPRHAPQDVAALAGTVAHEFNNLLGVIINFTTLAAGNLPPDSAAAEDLREVLAASSRAAEITQDLLRLGRSAAAQS